LLELDALPFFLRQLLAQHIIQNNGAKTVAQNRHFAFEIRVRFKELLVDSVGFLANVRLNFQFEVL